MQKLADYSPVSLKPGRPNSKGTMELVYTLIAGRYGGNEAPLHEAYGIKVCLRCGGQLESSTVIEDITCSRPEAEKLLDRLRRNTVTPTTVRDVIEDYLGG